jgi:hypothetical protein
VLLVAIELVWLASRLAGPASKPERRIPNSPGIVRSRGAVAALVASEADREPHGR